MISNLALLDELAKRNARKNLEYFTVRTYHDYVIEAYNRYLASALTQFVEDVAAGKMPRLMIMAPPRSGKSELASRRLPVYALGKHPKWNIISTSYSADLSRRMSRDCQRIIDSPQYHSTFDAHINSKNVVTMASAIRTADLWEIILNDKIMGAYRCAGVGGGITGQGMNIGIIDDPVKDYRQASSHVYQENTWDWYNTTFWSRMDPRINGIILIMTRWHKRDLAGMLLEDMKTGGEKWQVVRFPMIAEEDEFINGQLFRKEGDLLCPERMPLEFVERAKQRGTLVWNGLYQQRPTGKGGSVFQLSWFNYYEKMVQNQTAIKLEDGRIIKIKHKIGYGDTAQKDGEQNDYSVFELWGLGEDNRIYLLDLIRGKWIAPILKIKAKAFFEKHRYVAGTNDMGIRRLKIEDKSSGIGLIQELSGKIPVKGIPRNKDKVSRAINSSIPISEGRVVLPGDAPYLSDFLFEVEEFNEDLTHAFDDQIDPMLDAIEDNFHTTKKRAGAIVI